MPFSSNHYQSSFFNQLMQDLTKQTDAMPLFTMPLHLLVEYLFPLFPSTNLKRNREGVVEAGLVPALFSERFHIPKFYQLELKQNT